MTLSDIRAKTAVLSESDGFRVASLFLVNRLFLFGVGVMSVILFTGLVEKPDVHIHSSEVWLQIWGSWDTGYFLATARHGYVVGGELCRFPLYPLAIKAVAFFVGNFFVAALIVSNLALILCCVLIYRLVALEGPGPEARNACKYLLLFPSSCILSGAFSESLFLAVMLGSFYYARKRVWLLAGLLGMCAALTRSIGCLVFLPLLYEYMRSREFCLRAIRPDVLWLLLVPAGTLLFFSYLYVLTGNFFAYADSATREHFHVSFHNPFAIVHRLWFSFRYQSPDYFFNAALTILSVVGLTVFIRKIGVTYWLLAMLLIFVPLMSTSWIVVMSRYLSVVFPLFLLAAKLAERPWLDEVMTIAFGIIQGFVMAMWVLDMHFIV